jgi:hypothetical protein
MTYMLDLPTQETLMDIRRFDPATIDDREMDAMYRFSRSIIAERSPKSPYRHRRHSPPGSAMSRPSRT